MKDEILAATLWIIACVLMAKALQLWSEIDYHKGYTAALNFSEQSHGDSV